VTTLDDLHERFLHYFGENYDLDAIDAVSCAAAVEKFNDGSDPLWLLLVSGSGGCKTETVAPLKGAGALIVSTISSPGALLSGTAKKERAKEATGGLLRMLGPRGVMVLKDLTSLLSLNPGVRAEVLAAFREIYDGHWTRMVGTDGGRVLEWEGRIAMVGAVTTAWDRAHTAVASMGDRYGLLRMDSTEHRLASGRHAIANTGGEIEMREELAKLVGAVIADVDPDKAEDPSEEETERILSAADLVTLARTAVEFDYRGDVIDAHAPEAPTRFAKQLTQVLRGGIAIGLPRENAQRLAIRVARDSMPPLRLAIIDDLAEHPYSTPTEVRKRLGKPRATVDRQLQALHSLNVVTLAEVSGEHRTSWHYTLAGSIKPKALLVPDLSIKHTSTQKDALDPDKSGTNDEIPNLFSPEECARLGRCQVCGFHLPTQGHRDACPEVA
jgi:hypothetical protein